MPELTPDGQRAMTFWSQIEGAAALRQNTADLWSAIRDEAEARGLASPGVTVQGVNELRSYATAIQTAKETLAGARPDQGLDAGMIADAPWGRVLGSADAASAYQVRFEHTFTDAAGNTQTEWRTSMVQQLPETMADLQAIVEEDAMNMAADYGVAHGGVGAVSILRV